MRTRPPDLDLATAVKRQAPVSDASTGRLERARTSAEVHERRRQSVQTEGGEPHRMIGVQRTTT